MERIMRRKYVAGFLFHDEEVALVRKEKPDWQRGLLNGIGGKVEPGESSMEAMVREFREETALAVGRDQWHQFCREVGSDYCTDFFAARLSTRLLIPMTNDAGEAQGWVRLDKLHTMEQVGNLRWLIPMALDWRKIEGAVNAMKNDIVGRPSW
jgi:8-oxo-dGTP diphosphatase